MEDSSVTSPASNIAIPSPRMSSDDKSITVKELIVSILKEVAEERHECSARKSHSTEEERDLVLEAVHEQFKNEPPKRIPNWQKIDLMSIEAIDEESEALHKKYEDFWKEHEAERLELQATDDAYDSAFNRFQEIYRALGFRDKTVFLFNADHLSRYHKVLIESIFAAEAYRRKFFNRLHESSRASFEYSRIPRLLIILTRIESRQNGQGCRRPVGISPIDAGTLLKVLNEVAHTLRFISFADGLNKMTLEKLLARCYSRKLLKQPGPEEVEEQYQHFHLVFDCLMALDFKLPFKEIRDPLSNLFYVKYKSEPIYRLFEMVKTRRKLSRGTDHFKQLPLKEAQSPIFSPEHFNVQYLQGFGGLKVEWTNSLDEHLKIYTGRNAIRIFAHPTFLYSYIDMHQSERDYHEATFVELSFTYALLFGPPSRRKNNLLDALFSARQFFRNACNVIVKDNIASNYTSTNRILENFWSCSLPPTILAAYGIANPSTTLKSTDSWNKTTVTSISMRKILESAPFCPEDIKFMMNSVIEKEFNDIESFLLFPYFGPRLRQLKTFLDSQQPRNLSQLWRDGRDTRSWFIFWGLLFFCGLSLLLSFVSLALQARQIVHCF